MTTEKKLTPQILAMYLGVECKFEDYEGTKYSEELIAVNVQGFAWFTGMNEDAVHIKDDKVKPILRRLSSMTEEEFLELKDVYDKMPLQTRADVYRMYAAQVQRLASRGFDLFSLIDSGEAIEAKPGE